MTLNSLKLQNGDFIQDFRQEHRISLKGPEMEEVYFRESKFRSFEKKGNEMLAVETTYRVSSHQKSELSLAFVSFTNVCEETQILRNALRNTLQMFRLADKYVSILQEYISDDEYETAVESYQDIAMAYARTPRTPSSKDIAKEAKIVLKAVGENLGSADLADILNLDVMDVENALTQYSAEKNNGK